MQFHGLDEVVVIQAVEEALDLGMHMSCPEPQCAGGFQIWGLNQDSEDDLQQLGSGSRRPGGDGRVNGGTVCQEGLPLVDVDLCVQAPVMADQHGADEVAQQRAVQQGRCKQGLGGHLALLEAAEAATAPALAFVHPQGAAIGLAIVGGDEGPQVVQPMLWVDMGDQGNRVADGARAGSASAEVPFRLVQAPSRRRSNRVLRSRLPSAISSTVTWSSSTR